MDRVAHLTKGLSKSMKGIEIAPWFAPIASRREGWDVDILDVFDTEELRRRGMADPNQSFRDPEVLEEVDFVGNATEIADVVPKNRHGEYDFIVSSHNFEHLSNPIKFLQGCEQILKKGGILTMAVPDRRAIFDRFRPPTMIIDWLMAFHENRSRHNPQQLFAQMSLGARVRVGDDELFAHQVGEPPERWRCVGDIRASYETLKTLLAEGGETYYGHFSVMSPASLELMLYEARCLGLLSLRVDEVAGPAGCELFVRLVNVGPDEPLQDNPEEILQNRTRLLQAMMLENCDFLPQRRHETAVGRVAPPTVDTVAPPTRIKKIARAVRGAGRKLRGKPA